MCSREINRRLLAASTIMLLGHASAVLAETCEATFAKKGNPVTGLKYTAIHGLPDLSTADAINQLRGIVLAKGYDVLAAEPDAGNILMEMPQTANRRSVQVIGEATRDGNVTTVRMRANMRAGVFVKDDDMKSGMCGILAELQGGNAGAVAAARGKNATAGGGAPTVMTAQGLAGRVSNDADKNPDEIPLRYNGRSFTLSGRIENVRKAGDSYRVAYEIADLAAAGLRLPGQSDSVTPIMCLLAPGQSVYALTLKPKANVTLTGTYYDYRMGEFWLSECRPAR
jgi:hypothetical protein